MSEKVQRLLILIDLRRDLGWLKYNELNLKFLGPLRREVDQEIEAVSAVVEEEQ